MGVYWLVGFFSCTFICLFSFARMLGMDLYATDGLVGQLLFSALLANLIWPASCISSPLLDGRVYRRLHSTVGTIFTEMR
jgi:hypothetical protein